MRFFLPCLLLALPVFAQDPDTETEDSTRLIDRLKERVYVGGTLSVETAVETGTGDFQKFELQIQPEIEIQLSENADLTIIPRFRADALDELEPGRPNQDEISGISRRLLIGDHLELELREFYIETTVRDTYLTIGKQQIVWGEADGLKVLDVVNPTDFREFILDDFEDSRIPLWTLNVEIPIKQATLQLLWIPDQTYHNIPELDATYSLVSNAPTIPGGVTVVINEFDRPNDPIADSDVGARLSTFWKGWDLSLNYFYHYDDIPILYRTIALTPAGVVVTVNPGYERTHLIGGTFSNAFGNLTLRGEVGYAFDKYYSTADLTDVDGIHKTDEVAYVIGLDWFGFNEMLVSGQFFQNILTDNAPGVLRDHVENSLSLLVQRDFMNDTLVASVIGVHSINDGDGFVRPALAYEATSDINLWAGFDIFYGPGKGQFGQFDHRDRFVLGMEWGF